MGTEWGGNWMELNFFPREKSSPLPSCGCTERSVDFFRRPEFGTLRFQIKFLLLGPPLLLSSSPRPALAHSHFKAFLRPPLPPPLPSFLPSFLPLFPRRHCTSRAEKSRRKLLRSTAEVNYKSVVLSLSLSPSLLPELRPPTPSESVGVQTAIS